MRAALLALSVLSLAAIIAGIATVGGPGQARSDSRDATRLGDLNALYWHLDCLQGSEDTTPSDCPTRPRDRDPFTDQPYTIDLPSNGDILLCAEFENDTPLPEWINATKSPDAHGCLRFQNAR